MRKLIFLITLCFLLLADSVRIYAAETPSSIVNDLYPTEEEMNLNTDVELEYKKVPPEFYKWDSNLKFAEWDGVFPELKNPGDVTENTIWAAVFRSGVSLVRFGIFLLQMGFSTNILTSALSEMDGEIAAVADQFFTKIFPAASTLLVIFMTVAWVRGQKGKMFGMMLTALVVSTLLFGAVKNIDTLGQVMSGVIDDASLAVLGTINFKTEDDGGKKRLAETGNNIWEVTVEKPWTAGQFGSLTAPTFTDQERVALNEKGITIDTASWKELFLRYAPGSIERNTLVDILSDEDIPHANPKAPAMMKELAPPVRTFVSLISFANSLVFLLLALLVAGAMIVSGILLLAGMVAAPIMVPMPFLADYGMNIVKNYLGTMIGFGLLKIIALGYLSIVMLLLYLISLINFHFLIIQGVTLLILAVAIYLSPSIWKRVPRYLGNLTGITSKEHSKRNVIKRLAPQESIEKMYERYGAWRENRNTEKLMERNHKNQIRDTRNELESLQEIKRSNPAQYATSGLEQREQQITKELRQKELSRMSLTGLQNERFKYENKKKQGIKLSDTEKADLAMIQKQEQQQIRSHVKPEQRKELDQIWSQQQQLQQQKVDLQKQKATDPLHYTAAGGEAKMQHLTDKEQLLQKKERSILRENSLYDEKKILPNDSPLTKEERRNRDQLREYLSNQQGDSMMKNHLANESPDVATPERQTYIESLSHEGLKHEQDKYHAQIEQAEQPLSKEQKNDYMYLQHHDWMNTLQGIDDKEVRQQAENYHLQELNHESELIKLKHMHDTDRNQFEQMGGEAKRQEIQKNLTQARQQSQEVLRKNGHREMAERHALLAENRDIVRGDSSNKLNKVSEKESTQTPKKLKVENMSAGELKQQQETYRGMIKQGASFSAKDNQKYLDVQHHDWISTINTIGNENLQAELDSNFIQELDYEAELAQFEHWKETDPERFEEMGGEAKRDEIEHNSNQIKQQTQEILRNNGYSHIADHHMNLAESRDLMRDLTHSQEIEKTEQVEIEESNKVKTNLLDSDLIWDDYGYDDQIDKFDQEKEIQHKTELQSRNRDLMQIDNFKHKKEIQTQQVKVEKSETKQQNQHEKSSGNVISIKNFAKPRTLEEWREMQKKNPLNS